MAEQMHHGRPGQASRQDAALALSEELLADIELGRIPPDQLLLKASRLARLTRDESAAQWLGYEIHGYPQSLDAWDWIARMGRQTKQPTTEEGAEGYRSPLSALLAVRSGTHDAMTAVQGSAFTGDNIVTAAREQRKYIQNCVTVITQVDTIVARVTAATYEFATRVYYELTFSAMQAELFDLVRAQVDSRLAPASGTALDKIDNVADQLRDGRPEAVSAAMNSCRRLIDGISGALFPPTDDPYVIGEQAISVKESNVLNRLNAHVHSCGVSDGRRNRLRRTLADLYDRVSAGVHSDVTVEEARFLFLQTYLVLGEVLSLGGAPDQP